MPDAPSWAAGKRILLGITGGIAAYKTPELARIFVRAGCEVEVILTDAAASLVSPLALSTLIHRRAWRDCDLLSDERGWTIPHIALSNWADIFIVAPATANALRVACDGCSDTLLGAAMLAFGGRADRAPMLFFPAMNENMYMNPATRAHAAELSSRGHVVFAPSEGELACGVSGVGRMPEPEEIAACAWGYLRERDMVGRSFLITAGPTHEYLDPVRFLSNPSSGKMGAALASCAAWRGADVSLVQGPCSVSVPPSVRTTHVVSAVEMRDACMSLLDRADVIIKAAAVGDYRAAEYASHKIKREKSPTMTLDLVSNPDIARELSAAKRADQILVGFAAETNDVEQNARRKIESKGLDMVVANDVAADGAGFGHDTNDVLIIGSGARGGEVVRAGGTKLEVADRIIDAIGEILRRRA